MRVDRALKALRSQRFRLDLLQADDHPDTAFERSWRQSVKQRVLVVFACLTLWVAAIEARLVQLQVFQHDELETRARRHQEQRVPLEATRGDILDRNGEMLAYSVEARSIVADPSLVVDKPTTATKVCAALGDCSAKERKDLQDKLSRSTRYEVIRRSQAVSPEQVARVAALALPGIVTPSDSRRYYPRYELGAHVLGFVDRDSKGQAGVEYTSDKLVRGEDGLAFAQVDAKRQRLESRIERHPVPGAALELTLDLQLQYIAERELKAGVEAHRAKGGTAIIMAPETGEILALANYPTFNPNAVSRSDDDERRNRATQDVYEPGSTFKIVTASAALEEGVVTPDEIIDTRPGYIRFGSRIVDDDHKYGVMTFEDVIVKSSNVGAIKVGLRTGVDRLSRYVHRFGFGEVLAREDFAGQSRGIWNPNGLDESGLASVSMGYQVGVTPLQMVTAVSAVANGGLLMQPRIIRAVVRNGHREATSPTVLRRAISEDTAATLTTIMEGVVSARGTARQGSLTHYQAAGKTGTAKKIVNNRYSDTDYNASFVGFVPSRRPVFTILVVVDTPRAGTYYGGSVAAPIFKRIAEAALQQAGVPSTVNPPPPVLVTAATPTLPARLSHPPSLVVATAVGGMTVMPDVTGLSAREAVRVLTSVGLTVRPRGTGFVVKQNPAAGEPVDPGSWSLLELQRMDSAVETRGPR